MPIIFKTIKVVIWTIVAIVSIIVIFTSLNIFGLQMFVVKSGSMEPSIKTGSVVIVRNNDIYNANDVITFRSSAKGDTVTHRIISVSSNNNVTKYEVKGDANETPDSFPVLNNNVVGKVMFSVPIVGYLIAFIRTLPGLILLIIIPSMLIIIEEIKRIKSKKYNDGKYKNHTSVNFDNNINNSNTSNRSVRSS